MSAASGRTGLGPSLAGLAAFALYFGTLAPGLYWGDSAQLQLLTARPEIGLDARGYPLWVLLASAFRAVGGLDPARAANLVSALFGAAAVAAAYAVTRRLGARPAGAALAAATLGVSHLLWSASTVAEVYSASALLILLLLGAADRSRERGRGGPLLLGLVTGISLFHHRLVPLAAFALFLALLPLWRRERRLRRSALVVAGGVALGVVPLGILLFVLSGGEAGITGASRFFLGMFRPGLPAGLGLGDGVLGIALYEARFLVFNLAGVQLLLLPAGLREAGSRRRLLLALAAAGLLVPFLFPHIGDRYVLLLPTICAAAVTAGLGADRWLGDARVRALPWLAVLAAAAVPPIAYGALAAAAADGKVPLFAGADPAHTRAFLWPGKAGHRVPGEFGRRLIARPAENAVLFTGWGDGTVLEYLQVVEGLRPDLHLTLPAYRYAGRVWPREGRRVFASAYPYLPISLGPAPGWALQPVIPGELWELVPAADPEEDR